MGGKGQEKKEKDLFDQIQSSDRRGKKKPGSFFPRLRKSMTLSYENAIFLVIGFVMSCVISFSLGVEKGRHDVEAAGKTKETVRSEPGQVPARVAAVTETVFEEKKEPSLYSINVAAFRKKQSAEQAMAGLRREGYKAAVRRSGLYYQVYIGGFDERSGAEKLLKELKKKYNDCYIRKTQGG